MELGNNLSRRRGWRQYAAITAGSEVGQTRFDEGLHTRQARGSFLSCNGNNGRLAILMQRQGGWQFHHPGINRAADQIRDHGAAATIGHMGRTHIGPRHQ